MSRLRQRALSGVLGAATALGSLPALGAGGPLGAPVREGAALSLQGPSLLGLPPFDGAAAALPEPGQPNAATQLETGAASVAASARVSWRFRSASPLSGAPAVSASGLVYVTSVEGYVHALSADGRFRWSYGLSGIPLGAPAVDAEGRVYVATSEGRLHALGADGQLRWTTSIRGRAASAPVWVDGWVYLIAREHELYAVASGGGAPRRWPLGDSASEWLASPGVGLVTLGTSRGAAVLDQRALRVARWDLGLPLAQPLIGGGRRWFALTADGVVALDSTSHEPLWSAPARRAALSADGRSLVVVADRELRWLSPRTGEVLGRAPLPGDVSAPLALTNAAVALVPTVAGELWLVDPWALGPVRSSIEPAPLWAPVYDEASGRVTVTAGGSVATLELAGAGEPHRPEVHAARAPVPGGGA